MQQQTSPARIVSHMCLAGPTLSRDFSLAALLLDRHVLTLIEDPGQLMDSSVLSSICVVVLECGGGVEQTLQLIPKLKALRPELDIIVINGGATQSQVASAFQNGARDYFPAPHDGRLLAERIDGLSNARRRQDPEPPLGDRGR
jgi:DNA-binding NtrC family response regulator